MTRAQSKKRTKKKKSRGEEIRTDVWTLKATSVQKKLMQLTIDEYRSFLKPLVIIVNGNWKDLASLPEDKRINHLERLIHQTAKNPHHQYNYYQSSISKYLSFRKFPSSLRRATIAEAIGIVSSFQTRYREWQTGIRKKKTARPPKLTAYCKAYPALYKGQQIKYNDNYKTVDLKVWNSSDWVWLEKIPISKHGNNRHLIEDNELKSPALVVNSKKCQLSMPVKIKPVKKEDSDEICAVDLGINNAATCSIVGKDGTVKARKFINPAGDIDRRNKRRMMIATKSRQTQELTQQKLARGFCSGLYRKSNHINLEISRKVSREIIKFAKTYKVKVIVIENLSGWKAKAGRKGTLLKQKFHLWCHQKIIENLTNRWTELGGLVQTINPKYTSAYAFDGSGKVRRSKTNYSMSTFRTGKQYHSDLNGSINIGARYWYCLMVGDKNYSRVFDSKCSDGTRRTPVTLDTLRRLNAS